MFWHLTSMFGTVHKKTSLRHFLLFYFTFFLFSCAPLSFLLLFWVILFSSIVFILLSSCISIWYRFCLMFRLLWHNNFPNVEIVKVYPVLSLFSLETWYLHRYTLCLFKIGEKCTNIITKMHFKFPKWEYFLYAKIIPWWILLKGLCLYRISLTKAACSVI